MAEVSYASNGKGNLGVTLGAIGTGLAAFGGTGLLGNLLGRGGDPEDRPITRYEMNLISENAQLKAQQYSDAKAFELQNEIANQRVWNATQEAQIGFQQKQLDQLYGMTKLVIPNDAVMPGWGSVTIKPTA